MHIEEKLAQFILENHLFTFDDKILLGVSGGKDSMLMTALLHRLGYKLAIAHCNFQLRGEDSDKDEQLVKDTAERLGIPFFVKKFDTKRHAKANKTSIQMSARKLRYEWFDALSQEQQCDAVAIAQHRQDNIETVFINLIRGTGLQGLQGILPKRGNIVRPLLFMSTEEIKHAIQKYQVPYRDDRSNFSTKYIRNKIRLDILPLFREIKPGFDEVMAENIQKLGQAYRLLQEFVAPLREHLFIQQGEHIVIRKEDLAPHIHNIPLLYELFQPYGFAEGILHDLSQAWGKPPGLYFESPDFQLLLDRELLFLFKKDVVAPSQSSIDQQTDSVYIGDKKLSISTSDNKEIIRDLHIAQIDECKLIYPLQLRFWQEGDRFIPFGMTGEKKLSDFFIDQKIPVFEKKQIPLLVNGNGEIIWIVGYRLDNRYKITEITKKVVTFVFG